MCKPKSNKSTRGEAIKTLTVLLEEAANGVLAPATIVRHAVKAVLGDVRPSYARIYNDKRVSGFRVKVACNPDTAVEGRDLYRIYRLVSALFPADNVKVEFFNPTYDAGNPFANLNPQIRVYIKPSLELISLAA